METMAFLARPTGPEDTTGRVWQCILWLWLTDMGAQQVCCSRVPYNVLGQETGAGMLSRELHSWRSQITQ